MLARIRETRKGTIATTRHPDESVNARSREGGPRSSGRNRRNQAVSRPSSRPPFGEGPAEFLGQVLELFVFRVRDEDVQSQLRAGGSDVHGCETGVGRQVVHI